MYLSRTRICGVDSCSNTSKNCSLFTFPIDTSKAQKWENALTFKPGLSKQKKLVCADHFEMKCFTSTLRNKLVSTAVPTLQVKIKEEPEDNEMDKVLKLHFAWNNAETDEDSTSDKSDKASLYVPSDESKSDVIEEEEEEGCTSRITKFAVHPETLCDYLEKIEKRKKTKEEIEKTLNEYLQRRHLVHNSLEQITPKSSENTPKEASYYLNHPLTSSGKRKKKKVCNANYKKKKPGSALIDKHQNAVPIVITPDIPYCTNDSTAVKPSLSKVWDNFIDNAITQVSDSDPNKNAGSYVPVEPVSNGNIVIKSEVFETESNDSVVVQCQISEPQSSDNIVVKSEIFEESNSMESTKSEMFWPAVSKSGKDGPSFQRFKSSVKEIMNQISIGKERTIANANLVLETSQEMTLKDLSSFASDVAERLSNLKSSSIRLKALNKIQRILCEAEKLDVHK